MTKLNDFGVGDIAQRRRHVARIDTSMAFVTITFFRIWLVSKNQEVDALHQCCPFLDYTASPKIAYQWLHLFAANSSTWFMGRLMNKVITCNIDHIVVIPFAQEHLAITT